MGSSPLLGHLPRSTPATVRDHGINPQSNSASQLVMCDHHLDDVKTQILIQKLGEERRLYISVLPQGKLVHTLRNGIISIEI